MRTRAPEPFVLKGGGASCRVRTWSGDVTVAQLVLYQQRQLPTPDDLRSWIDELGWRGFRAVRTGALNARQADVLEPFGFAPIQYLALLEHRAPQDVPRPVGTTERLQVNDHEAASTVDHAAFGPPWGLDPAAIDEVRNATHRHRARTVHQGDRLVAFAISGRDGRVGFLQRLAVDPAAQRAGLGRRLVLDSLRWSARWRAGRVLVNTHVGNDAALALYASTGFERLPDQLVVLERPLRSAA